MKNKDLLIFLFLLSSVFFLFKSAMMMIGLNEDGIIYRFVIKDVQDIISTLIIGIIAIIIFMILTFQKNRINKDAFIKFLEAMFKYFLFLISVFYTAFLSLLVTKTMTFSPAITKPIIFMIILMGSFIFFIYYNAFKKFITKK